MLSRCISLDCDAECCDYYGQCPDFFSSSAELNRCWYYYAQAIDQPIKNVQTDMDFDTMIALALGGSLLILFLLALGLFLYTKCR